MNIEMSQLLDKAGDALSGSNLIISPNAANANGSHSQFIQHIPGPTGKEAYARYCMSKVFKDFVDIYAICYSL